MAWDLEVTDEFEQWWMGLVEAEQVAIDAMVRLLESYGSALGPPYSVEVAAVPRLRQLRIGHERRVIDVLYFCYPWRSALVLLSGAIRDAVAHVDAGHVDRARHTLTAYLGRCERRAS